MTLESYYASFKSKAGAFTAAFAVLPFLSKILPPEYSAYGYPPLGEAEILGRIGTVAFALFSTYVSYFICNEDAQKARKWVRNAFIFGFIVFLLYLGCFIRFIRTVEIPTRSTSISVSVGFERSDFAKRNFASQTDFEMLRARGPYEEEIAQLWTPRSLVAVRVALFLLYSLVLSSFVCAFSWGIIADMLGNGANKP
jgi:hypothetical protein